MISILPDTIYNVHDRLENLCMTVLGHYIMGLEQRTVPLRDRAALKVLKRNWRTVTEPDYLTQATKQLSIINCS